MHNCNSYVLPLLVWTAALIGGAALRSYGESDPPSPPPQIGDSVQLRATLNTNRVVATQPVVLTAMLQNNWTNEISISLMLRPLDCQVVVRSALGDEIPPTRFHQKLLRMASECGDYARAIPPEGTYVYEVPVSQLFDMSCPEKYSIRARMRVFFRTGQNTKYFDVESDPIDITVLRRPVPDRMGVGRRPKPAGGTQ